MATGNDADGGTPPRRGMMRRTAAGFVRAAARSMALPQIRHVGGDIVGFVRTTLRPPADARVETFSAAVERLGLDQAALGHAYRGLRLQAAMALAVSVMLAGLACYYGWLGRGFATANAVLVAGIAFAFFLTRRFRCWQLRHRRLGGWDSFVADPAAWFRL